MLSGHGDASKPTRKVNAVERAGSRLAFAEPAERIAFGLPMRRGVLEEWLDACVA